MPCKHSGSYPLTKVCMHILIHTRAWAHCPHTHTCTHAHAPPPPHTHIVETLICVQWGKLEIWNKSMMYYDWQTKVLKFSNWKKNSLVTDTKDYVYKRIHHRIKWELTAKEHGGTTRLAGNYVQIKEKTKFEKCFVNKWRHEI